MLYRIREILTTPFKLWEFLSIAYHSDTNTLEVFKVLSQLHLKRVLFPEKDNQVVSQKILGFKIYSYRYRSIELLFHEIILNKEYYTEFSKKGPVILDCGANVGMATFYLKRLFPESKITCVEANPYTYELLQKNITENGLQNVEAINAALSDSDGTIDIFVGNNKSSLRVSIFEERSGGDTVPVKAMKLSELFLKHQPDIVKIDIEGAEIQVVQELKASNTLNLPAQYMVEYHHNIDGQDSNLSSFLAAFEEAGYNYSIRTDFGERGKFQDLFIHFYKR